MEAFYLQMISFVSMQKKSKYLSLTFIALVASFVYLSFYINYTPIPKFDLVISTWIQQFHSNWLDQLMLGISVFGELPYSLFSVLLVAIIFYLKKYKRESYFIAAILLSGLVILAIKNLINRPRPTEFYVRLVEINRFESYPSGHVLSYVLFFGFLILLMNRLIELPLALRNTIKVSAYFLVISIPISRIYLGAHWFTDTLGGLLLGLICLIPLALGYLNKKRG